METIFTCAGTELRNAMPAMKEAVASRFGPAAANLFEETFVSDRSNISNAEKSVCANTSAYQQARQQAVQRGVQSEPELEELLKPVLAAALPTVRVTLDADVQQRRAVLVVTQTAASVGPNEMVALNCQFPAMSAPAEA